MNTTIILAAFLFFLYSQPFSVYSQSLVEKKLSLTNTGKENKLIIEDKISTQGNFKPLKKPEFLGSFKNDKKDFSAVYENTAKKKKKSVALGVIFSAIIPGSGEFYGEEYLRAGIFFGIELLAWGTYLYFENKGDNKTEEYQQYADANWDVRRYARWLNDQFQAGVDPNAEKEELRRQINEYESTHFSHTLPPYGSQQYYELIGKYQNFMGGWADAESNGNWIITANNYYNLQTSMFKGYAAERQKANDFYDYAKVGPITAILNHVLSAADAAWVIAVYNNRLNVQTGFRMNNMVSPYTYEIEQVPTFNMKVSF